MGTWKSNLVQLPFDDANYVNGYVFVVKISAVIPEGTPPPKAPALVGYLAREGQPRKSIGGFLADFWADTGLALRWDFKEMNVDGLAVRTKVTYDSRIDLRIDANDPGLLRIVGVDRFASGITGKNDILLRRIDNTNSPPSSFLSWSYSSDKMR